MNTTALFLGATPRYVNGLNAPRVPDDCEWAPLSFESISGPGRYSYAQEDRLLENWGTMAAEEIWRDNKETEDWEWEIDSWGEPDQYVGLFDYSESSESEDESDDEYFYYEW